MSQEQRKNAEQDAPCIALLLALLLEQHNKLAVLLNTENLQIPQTELLLLVEFVSWSKQRDRLGAG